MGSSNSKTSAHVHSNPSGKPYALTGTVQWPSTSVQGSYSQYSSSMFAQHTKQLPRDQSVTFGAGASTNGRVRASVGYSIKR